MLRGGRHGFSHQSEATCWEKAENKRKLTIKWKRWGISRSTRCTAGEQSCSVEAKVPCFSQPCLGGSRRHESLAAQKTQVPSHVRWDRSAFQVTLAASWRLVLEMRVVLHCYEGRQTMFGAEEAVGEELVSCIHCTWKETLCTDEAFIWPR